MLTEQRGNVVLLAGNNGRKIDYIERSVGAGLNVFADKPLVIDSAGFARLERVFSQAGGKGVLVYDIMTERYDLLNILQRELMRDSALFGIIVKGTPQQPAVEVTSIHSFYKEVAGKPLTRPAWCHAAGRGDCRCDDTFDRPGGMEMFSRGAGRLPQRCGGTLRNALSHAGDAESICPLDGLCGVSRLFVGCRT